MAHVAGGHWCEPIDKHTAVGVKNPPYPLLPKALEALDMAPQSMKKRERWRENWVGGGTSLIGASQGDFLAPKAQQIGTKAPSHCISIPEGMLVFFPLRHPTLA